MKKLEQNDLDRIISRLTETFVIDQIFLWTFEWEEQTNYMLQILMQKGGGQYFTEANIYTNSVVKEYERIDYVICYPNEIIKKIRQGLGRAALICQPENLIYQNPEAKETVELMKFDFESLLDKTQRYIEKERNKIQAFIEGYEFYFDKGNLGHAAFMLHQVIELIFRIAEQLLISEERRTHCLITHQNYVGKFTHTLGDIFHTPERKRILNKLDKAYSAVRYDQGYRIKKKKLETAYQLTTPMLTWLSDYSVFLLQEIQEKLSHQPPISINPKNTVIMKTAINTDHRDLILNAIETYCTPTTVRCFAYRRHGSSTVNLVSIDHRCQESHQYYLMLAVSEAKTPTANLQSAIENMLPDFIKIVLLPFETHHFQERCDKGEAFYLTLAQQSELWYESKEKAIIVSEKTDILDVNQSERKIQWIKVLLRAKQLYHAHADDLFFGPEEVACYGLALALEQICLGLIRTFWNFQPQSTNLNHLMQFCELICPEATSIFVLDNPSQRQIFKLLVDAQQQFRHNTNYQTQGQHLQKLAERVEAFIEITTEHVEVHFGNNTNKLDEVSQAKENEEMLCA